MTEQPESARGGVAYAVLCGCMFLSGIAGLVYQVVWSRYLALFLGSTGRAQIIILATFMGGLGLGSYLFGRRADAIRNPLRLYGLLEIGIAGLGIIYPVLVEPIRSLFLSLVKMLGLNPTGLSIAAATTCALTVLLPTTLMGGTLPVLGKYLIRSTHSIGRRIATLYYINSLGAVIGAVITGFYLMRIIGLHGTIMLAALLNLLAAMCAIAVLAMEGNRNEEDAAADDAHDEGEEVATRGPMSAATIAVAVIGISGAVSFFLEIAWVRMLTLVLGSASNSFALMLAAFISGITLGSYLLSRKRHDGNYFQILGWSLVAVGLTTLLTMFGYERLPVILNQWKTIFARDEHAYVAFQFASYLICFAVMVVPTIFMGMTLPCASRVASRSLGSVGRKVGGVFAVNTFGSLLGAAIGGFVLLPAIGIRHLIDIAVAIDVLLGMWILLAAPPRGGSALWSWKTAAILVVLVAGGYIVGVPQWDQRAFTSATYRLRERLDDLDDLKKSYADRNIVFYRDGKDATVAVSKDRNHVKGETDKKVLLINGKPDASTGLDMYSQRMLAHIGMMLHPKPENVLVVGFGSGVTIGSVSLYDTKIAECVELIPEVLQAGEEFKDFNHDVLHNPKVSIILQDAKTHMQISPHDYDLIISEPTNPWITGVSGLFSVEYLKTARSKLRPGGLFIQWLHTYEIKDETVFSILNTYNEVFPYSILLNQMKTDLMIVGSTTPFDPDFKRMEAILGRPDVEKDTGAFGIRGLYPVLAMQMVAKNRTAGPYIMLDGINSDYYPQLEYDAQVGFFVGKEALMIREIDRRYASPANSSLWVNEYTPSQTPPESVFIDYFNVLKKLYDNDPRPACSWCDAWAKFYPDSPRLKMARVRAIEDREELQLERLRDPAIASSDEGLTSTMRLLYRRYAYDRSWAKLPPADELRKTCSQVIDRKLPDAAFALEIVGEVQRDAGEFAEAEKSLLLSLATNKGTDERAKDARKRVHLRLANVYTATGDFAKAREQLREVPPLGPYHLDRASLGAHILECRIQQKEKEK